MTFSQKLVHFGVTWKVYTCNSFNSIYKFKANGICIDIDCKSWIRCIQLSHFAVCYFLFFNILKISATFLVLETLFTNSHTDRRYVWGISKKLLAGDLAGTNFVLFLTKFESYIIWKEFSNCSNDKYLIKIRIYVKNWQ